MKSLFEDLGRNQQSFIILYPWQTAQRQPGAGEVPETRRNVDNTYPNGVPGSGKGRILVPVGNQAFERLRLGPPIHIVRRTYHFVVEVRIVIRDPQPSLRICVS